MMQPLSPSKEQVEAQGKKKQQMKCFEDFMQDSGEEGELEGGAVRA